MDSTGMKFKYHVQGRNSINSCLAIKNVLCWYLLASIYQYKLHCREDFRKSTLQAIIWKTYMYNMLFLRFLDLSRNLRGYYIYRRWKREVRWIIVCTSGDSCWRACVRATSCENQSLRHELVHKLMSLQLSNVDTASSSEVVFCTEPKCGSF